MRASILFLCALLPAAAHAATVRGLDPAFGSRGTTAAVAASSESGASAPIAVQGDGAVVTVGQSAVAAPSTYDLVILRHLADGTPDATFGGGTGQVVTRFETGYNAATGLAIQGDGKIVVGGTCGSDTDRKLCVARYLADGSRDTAFGTGGVATMNPTAGLDGAGGLAIQGDGKILLSGHAPTIADVVGGLLVARWDASGVADAGFGAAGLAKVTFDTLAFPPFAGGLALQSTGKIVVAGWLSCCGGANNAALARLGTDGQLDLAFGAGTGKVVTTGVLPRAILALPDDRLLVAGPNPLFIGAQVVVRRFDAAGAADAAYGTSGSTTVVGFTDTATLGGMVLRGDGKLVLAGRGTNKAGSTPVTGLNGGWFARLQADGTKDTTYNGIGFITGLPPGIGGLALASGNRPVASGSGTALSASRLLADIPDPILVWRDSGGAVAWWMLANGAVTGAGFAQATPDWTVAATGDSAASGRQDLFWWNATLGAGYLWRLDGTAVTGTHDLGVLGPQWRIERTGDFNGDGRTDLLFRRDDGLLYLWHMDGGAVLSQGAIGQLGADWQAAGALDTNGDGRDEIVFFNAATRDIWLWFLDGFAVTAQPVANPDTTRWNFSGAITGGISLAGSPFLRLVDAGGNYLYLGLNGAAVTSAQGGGNPGVEWAIRSDGRFDADGATDTVFRRADGTVWVWWSYLADGPLPNPGGTWEVVAPR